MPEIEAVQLGLVSGCFCGFMPMQLSCVNPCVHVAFSFMQVVVQADANHQVHCIAWTLLEGLSHEPISRKGTDLGMQNRQNERQCRHSYQGESTAAAVQHRNTWCVVRRRNRCNPKLAMRVWRRVGSAREPFAERASF